MTIGRLLINPPKISTRLRTVSLISLAGTLLLATAALSVVEYFTLRQALVSDSRVEAKILADNVAAAVVFQDHKAARETLLTMRASKILNQVSVLLPDGQVFASASLQQSDWQKPPSLLTGQDARFTWRSVELNAPIEYQGDTIGYVSLDKSLSQLYWQTLVYAACAIGVSTVALLLSGLVVSRTQRAVAGVEAELLRMAHIDAVTGLWNRNTFNEHLAALMSSTQARDQKIALIILDLDNFKSVNDNLGHQAGDKLLAIVSSRLFNLLGDQDVVFRLGGDEFALVMKRSDESALPVIADSITRLFAAPFVLGGQVMTVTCSLGISIFPDDASDTESLVRNADMAMYQAKVGGKNNYRLFNREMQQHLQRRLALENGLRYAIVNNELSLHFQPLYRLQDLELVGAEVLLRWHSADLGTVSPAEFIPIAEESGLIVAIGEWVLRMACQQLNTWQQSGLYLPRISVNVSARQLRTPNLPERFLDIIAEVAIDPECVELELTESIMMENLASLIDDFAMLQQKGVKIAIDDFGTGYSSMAYLKRLPLDCVKIDRSFIQDLPHSTSDREIVAAMIAVGHNLGLRVTAEGVEHSEQAAFLAQAGCDTVQGFHYGKPMPCTQFEQLLRQAMFIPTSGEDV